MNPTSSRNNVIDKMAQAMLHGDAAPASCCRPLCRRRWPRS
jgi:hypothetical protein